MKLGLFAIAIAAVPSMVSFGPIGGQAPPARAVPRVAYVSLQRIVSESPRWKAQFDQVPAMQKQKAAEIRAKQQSLETTRQGLVTTDGNERVKLQDQERRQRAEVEREALQAQNDIQSLQRRLNADLQKNVKAVVDQLIQGRSVDVVLTDSAIVWAAPGADLTAEVIERLNATSPKN